MAIRCGMVFDQKTRRWKRPETTDRSIRELRAGDLAQVAICDRALAGWNGRARSASG